MSSTDSTPRTKAEVTIERSTAASRAILDAEKAERDEKTARLRAQRLAREEGRTKDR